MGSSRRVRVGVPRIRRGIIATLTTVLTVVTLAATISSAHAAPEPTPVRYTGGPYVAMGDSRASGGFFTPTPDYFLGCKRSAFNYPAVVAVMTLPRHFVDTSCAGAQAPHLYRTAQRTNVGAKPPQLHLVPRDAQVITVSIGGNDMRWGAILSRCNTAPLNDRRCRHNPQLEQEVRWRIARMENRVTPALRAIRKKAPRAQIIVVGIGGFMGNHGCWPMVPVSDPDVRWMNRVFDRAGDALRRATTKVDGTFIDANRRSAGHDPCNLINPWYESSLSNGSIAYPYHINQAGAIAIASMVNAAIRR
ncbi:SGNH/GDSL hydrolase family protein [Gordonia sp. PKS22-38]|uniref:SGNH/GDSL hydrolase family protein n=1 Tax=Gordonia prachuapensis TaxID=3115651 RepID=A0ABU7MVI0_9ACTN|nr:SGNH/GDSL hydrolase family protein [Gordonia sp. PKS22-38]